MQQAPPQFSPDGLYWWDGGRWVARATPPQPVMPPVYSSTASNLKPSPGLRIALLVFLALTTAASGFLVLGFTVTVSSGDFGPMDFVLGFAFTAMFGLSIASIVGASMRTVWAKWLAIGCGLLVSWTVVGLLLGIPIIVTAARAPDLMRR